MTGTNAEDSRDAVVLDELVGSLARLEDGPVFAHVAVFEDAHEKLRNALADPGDAGRDA
ncbi:MAG: hypothetical protein M3393_01330 [Actinomycetota bacterium]|nr:hypothetical protein [Actinomycetota bacterium]